MDGYMTIPEAAVQWRASAQAVRQCCEQQGIERAVCIRGRWFIPVDAPMPQFSFALPQRSVLLPPDEGGERPREAGRSGRAVETRITTIK